MELSSSTFAPRGEVPRRHTCEGEDIAPPLQWRDVPEGAASLVLIVGDHGYRPGYYGRFHRTARPAGPVRLA